MPDLTPMHPTQPNQAEPVPVQLARMEGTLNLIAYQFGEVKDDIKQLRDESKSHGDRLTAVELVQASQAGAATSWRVWLPILGGLAGVAVAIVALVVR